VVDSGATSHIASNPGMVTMSPSSSFPPSIIVGNGATLPVVGTGYSTIPGPFRLNNVLIAPAIIQNLLSVRQFTTDNRVSVEFDPSGISVKDLHTRNVLLRCDSSGPLYTLQLPSSPISPCTLVATPSSTTWHRRLGHPGKAVLQSLVQSSSIACSKTEDDSLCHACQLGRHVRLPFSNSLSRASKNFDVIHCDLWTSPIMSISGFKYYLVILDDCSHFLWTFPLRLKSDTFPTLSNFFTYVHTQFGCTIKSVQCDNGREFDNSASRAFFLAKGVTLRMSCPYTSQQNGKAERTIRTTNNVIRTLLFQASMPPSYWADALATATHLLNRLPTKTLNMSTPFFALHGSQPSYHDLRAFGCTCYPNLTATTPHKLAPRSSLCAFLGYSPDHKGYKCLDIASNRVIISRHVVFDETTFPFSTHRAHPPPAELDFLTDDAPLPVSFFPAGTSGAAGTLPAPAPKSSGASLGPPPGFATAPQASAPPVLPPSAAPPAQAPPSPAPPVQLLPQPHVQPPAAPTFTKPPVVHVYARRASTAGPSPTATSSPAADSSPASPPRPPPRRSGLIPSPPRYVKQDPPLPMGAVPIPPVANTHGMATRGKIGYRQPRLALHAAALSPLPRSCRDALADPHWRQAMEDEFAALTDNHTWDLIPRPPQANVVTGKWIFKHKFHADGSLDRYKARWVLRGFTQRPGVDYDETFSPVVKPATVRTVLTLAHSRDWPIHQLDVKNAFLHGILSETVYCSQPTGFVDPALPGHVCRLNKSLYGLKQAPRAWHTRFASHLLSLGFTEAKSDTSLFIYHHGTETAYLLLYVDNIVLTASSQQLLHRVIAALKNEFAMKDLDPLHHFLGVAVQHRSDSLFLSQRQYTLDILARHGMSDCKPCTTPVDTCAKIAADDGPSVADPTAYRSLVGALQYLTFTRPDITYAVQQVCLHMHDPRETHLVAAKRILRYLQVVIPRSTPTQLTVYTDADWAGCPDTRRSTSGYAVFLGNSLVSWSSKCQPTVSRSSAEAEYRAVANGVAEATWLRQLLQELHQPLQSACLVYCDNVSAVYLSTNPIQHQRTKHVEIDLHFVRERVAIGAVRVLHVPTTSQFADVFTKGLPSTVFMEFRSSLNVRANDAPTAGGC